LAIVLLLQKGLHFIRMYQLLIKLTNTNFYKYGLCLSVYFHGKAFEVHQNCPETVFR